MAKDLNKGITSIQYNSLNLPRQMDIKSPVAEAMNSYTYSAGGVKLSVKQDWNPNFSTTPVIGSAVTIGSMTQTKTTDYVGNKVYENGTLKRILVDGGYIESGVYYFNLTDHLGNNRIVANASGTAIQKNHYYRSGWLLRRRHWQSNRNSRTSTTGRNWIRCMDSICMIIRQGNMIRR
ncbi:MAG: hypothetical protein LBV43_07975 [Prevotella sp.]|jgi:hypothetical protein|nr:hypothetical protein [Prevotella sp.]